MIYAYVYIHVVHIYIHIGYDGVEVMGSEGYLINQVIFFKSQLTTKSNVEKNCIADLWEWRVCGSSSRSTSTSELMSGMYVFIICNTMYVRMYMYACIYVCEYLSIFYVCMLTRGTNELMSGMYLFIICNSMYVCICMHVFMYVSI